MAKVYTPYGQYFLDMERQCRNWRQTNEGSDIRMGNRAKALQNLAVAVNRCLSRLPRPWAWMAYPVSVADATGSDPLYIWKLYDGVVNARDYTVRILAVPRAAGSGDCYAELESGAASEATSLHNVTVASVDAYEDAFYDEFPVNRGAAADALITPGLSTWNGFTALDVVFQDDELGMLDTALHDYCDPTLAITDDTILADLLEQIRAAFHNLRKENLGMAACYAAQLVGGVGGTPASTDEHGIVITSNTYVNVIDQSVTARSATSPGHSCPAQYMGRGPEDETEGQTLRVDCEVYAEATNGGSDGKVKFEGPLGSTEITVTGGAGEDWYGSGNHIDLDTTKADTDVTAGRNKIDPMGKVAAGTLYIYEYTCRYTYE